MAHRTALVAAGSIAIVIVAAAVAVGANLGILDAADSRPVGQLSASAAQPQSQAAAKQPAAAGTATPLPQQYVIRKAGTVSVTAGKTGLRLTDVSVRHGWKWALAQSADKRLTVTFKKGPRTYTFAAVLGKHHTILARADRPVTKVVPAAAPSGAMTTYTARAAAPARAPAAGVGGQQGDDHSGGEADD
jgi:hypothetical protein